MRVGLRCPRDDAAVLVDRCLSGVLVDVAEVLLLFEIPLSGRTCSKPRVRVGLRCPRDVVTVLVVRCSSEVLDEVAVEIVSHKKGKIEVEDEALGCCTVASDPWKRT